MTAADHNESAPVALVTGAGSGIGRACATELARRGNVVVVVDRDKERAEAVSADIEAQFGATSLAIEADISEPDAVDRMLASTLEQFGRLDAAVNNAGIGAPRAVVADTEFQDWQETIAVNLHGTFLCLRAELRVMRALGGGAVVNIGSIYSVLGSARSAAYAASKHAIVGLTRSAALDHAADGIRVNAVGPGYVRTPMLEHSVPPDQIPALELKQPLGRLASPGDVAALVAFLLSADARNITGALYMTDGGYTIQ